MVSLNHVRTLKTPRPIYVTKGKNRGHQIGLVKYEENYPPYFLIIKQWRSRQLFFKPELRELMWLSETAIKDAERAGAQLVIYHIVGYEAKTFFLVFELKEFIESTSRIGYDDPQKGVSWKSRPRHYGFPLSSTLLSFVQEKKK